MSEKCCGKCRNFSGEDIFGNGICLHTYDELHCTNSICQYYEPNIEGWAEITPDNEHELTDELLNRIIIGFNDCEGRMHTMTLLDCYMGVGTMVKHGGYYYYVLPELKIEWYDRTRR